MSTIPKPATDKPLEPLPSNSLEDEIEAWEKRIMDGVRRMSQDEDYRREIAKKLS